MLSHFVPAGRLRSRCNLATVAAMFCLLSTLAVATPAFAACTNGVLQQPTVPGEALLVNTACEVKAGTYLYGDVNIVAGGALSFDDAITAFWASSILIENKGSLTAGSVSSPFGTNGGLLTIYLWGADQGKGGQGITCKSDTKNQCGVPDDIWTSTGPVTMCNGVTDNFYPYMPLDYDNGGSTPGYFGYKVLGVSCGGTLQLFGLRGATYPDSGDNVLPPSDSGRSWARLLDDAGGSATNKNVLVIDRAVGWQKGQTVVVTTTDYLPGHSEERTIQNTTVTAAVSVITLTQNLTYFHSGHVYPLSSVPEGIGPDCDPNRVPNCKTTVPPPKGFVETRAAVALLDRYIRIASGGNTLNKKFDEEDPHYFFGGHTVFRQGFQSVQIQGVEFDEMGQGGKIMHYPVHFHMARKTPPNTFIKDSVIRESMTRWIVLHATQGVTVARNVGYKSIGHGFYLEDGTETDNKFYSNLGIFARGAVDNAQNPRLVPGILAATYPDPVNTPPGRSEEEVPFHSDADHPTAFWIMNGWNDFQYNHAAGAGTCGTCYWLVPGYNSGMSREETWVGYASEQGYANWQSDPEGALGRAAMTPLKSFVGNTCSTAMNAFNTVGDTSVCHGVVPENPAANIPQMHEVPNPLAPDVTGPLADAYYPKVDQGGGRFATACPSDTVDCSQVIRCSNGHESMCKATVINHFTTSFNFTETNFSAVWLRPQWYLLINSAITDVQNGGLTFVTGGGYTSSDVIYGHWALAKKDVFIGATDPNNPFASEAGPVNAASGLACERRPDGSPAGGDCLLRNEGIAYTNSSFGVNQRFFNIYDGPAYEEDNAYLDIKPTSITDCTGTDPNTGGPCWNSTSMYGWFIGMPRDKNAVCYLPNAAIGWKQPNGFYYPPAFHSANLYFNNVDIRHFVIQPLFEPGTIITDPAQAKARYCTWVSNMFTGFTDVDRQTELTDDDGTLTGLHSGSGSNLGPTISVNQDPYFNAPLATTECASDASSNAPNATAITSPYDYVSTAILPDCGANCTIGVWDSSCSNENCYGVPLYREYVNQSELGTQPSIRMMGQDIGQRSTMSVNNGSYYLDTQVTPAQQGPYLFRNVFEAGRTYNVFFLFAKPTTTQTYSIYVGPGFSLANDLHAVLMDNSGPSFSNTAWPSTWGMSYVNNVLTITTNMNFTAFQNGYTHAQQDHCQPAGFCSLNSAKACGCSLSPGNSLYNDCQQVCSTWTRKDVDCPEGGCYGFSFKLPTTFATGQHQPPATACYPQTNTWNPQFSAHDVSGQQCYYSPVPTVQTCH